MELKNGGKIDFVKYIRTRDKNIIDKAKKSEAAMIIDAGGENDFEKFNIDHHQLEGAGSRENGIDYATAGLVWKYFGKEWIKYIDVYSRNIEKDKHIHEDDWDREDKLTDSEIQLIWNMIDENYVEYIDMSDTGQMESMTCRLKDGTEVNANHFSFKEIIRLYNIDTRDGKSQTERFNAAIEVMRSSMLSIVYKYIDLVEGLRDFKKEKTEFISDGRAVIINQTVEPVVTSYILDTGDEFKNAEYVAVLNKSGGYSIMPVPIKEGLRIYRNPDAIPAELRLGNNPKEINSILGIKDGVTFSHTAGFFASCKNIETAKRFLEYCTK